jgi:hypothetical protein
VPFRLRPLKPASDEAVALGGLWTTLVDLALAALAAAACVNLWAPPQDLPWKPFRLDRPPGLATGVQLARAAADPALCRAALREGGVDYIEEPDRVRGGCATGNTLRLEGQRLSPAAPVATCPLGLAYAWWLRHEVQPAAQELLGTRIARVEHYGTYACRNVYGRAEGRRSEHAFANALDVAAFRTDGGRRISVLRDFRREDAKGRFLRRVRSAACGPFRTVLSPDYNAAHADHLHLDYGRFSICR